MEIRAYRPEDLTEILRLFHDTIHSVCRADYSPAQLEAWSDGKPDRAAWARRLDESDCRVACADGRILGFGNMLPGGRLDLFYVHRDAQRRGVGRALLGALERAHPERPITLEASVTALPFFEAQGYRAVRAQTVWRRGVALTNCVMEKRG